MTFDFEKMLVYRKSLEALDSAVKISESIPRGNRHYADQLKRAASSVCLNIAEGAGEFKPLEKARFYRMALRSASESSSVIQILFRLNFIRQSEFEPAYHFFCSTGKMLTKLISSVEKREKNHPDAIRR